MRARSWLILALVALAALLLTGRALTTIVVEYEWFASLGHPELWWERMTSTVLLQGGLAVAGTLFAFANLTAVRRTILAVAVPQRVGDLELTAMVPGQRLAWVAAVLSLVIGGALAIPFDDWTLVSLARHGEPFGEMEGFHNRDLGFYVYWLPLEQTLYVWALAALVVVSGAVLILYALTRSVRVEGRRIIASSHVRRHMSVLAALVLVLLSWSYRLDSFDLLRDGSGPDGLFMRVDHVVTMRVDAVLIALAAVASVLLLRYGWMGQTRAALVVLGGVLVAAIGLRHALPSVLARGNTIGEPARRESDYVATRALVSRRAFDSDAIRVGGRDSSVQVDARIPLNEIAMRVTPFNLATMRSEPARTGSPAPDAQLPATQPAFVPTARGTVGMLMVRRPVVAGDAWRIHMFDLGTSTPIAQDLQWQLPNDSLHDADPDELREPLVAPGLSGYRLLADHTDAVPGPRLDSPLSRLAHAWNARDPALLAVDGESRLIFVSHRDVRDRVGRLAPVFAQGSDVLPLLHDGMLYWTLELYSASADYPLSQQWLLAGADRSYFRHAGTALVDAATGQVRLIPVLRPDPVARTWMRLVPALWISVADLPPALGDALPPATDGAIAQLRTFARHGSRYEGQVLRQFPDSGLVRDQLTRVLARSGESLVPAWTVPLLDLGDRLGGVATAVGGRVRLTTWDTTAAPRPSWTQSAERLRGALDSARARLPDGSRRDSRLRAGRLHAVMTSSGPVIIQAVHQGDGTGSGAVAHVALQLGDRIGAAADLFGSAAQVGGTPVAPGDAPAAAIRPEAREALLARLYDSMRDALRRADWPRFGAVFDSLGQVLGRPPQ